MFYLIYMSSAVKPMNSDALSALLEQSRKSNLKLGITGMLIYQKGTFLQMLEGEKPAIMDLYNKILDDQRHTGVHTVLSGEIEKRNFEDWSMGFFNMDKAGEFPKYSDYIDKNLALGSFETDSLDAYNFMVLFSKLD